VPRPLRGWALAAASFCLLAGCGGGGATRFTGEDAGAAGGGGTLEVAVASLPERLDPLRAAGPSQRLAIRQIFEPLVSRQSAPYAHGEPRRGVAFDWEGSADLRVWRFRLRPGIGFQDGTRLDARAVVANAERWRTDPAGAALLPGLIAADAPNPGLVRLIFAAPLPAVPGRLSDPRLGLVSPLALRPSSGTGARVTRGVRAGSGPFEFKSRQPRALGLIRFRRWWGSRRELGPALDSVAFRLIPGAAGRAEALRAGAVRVAADLPLRVVRSLRRDPLLYVLRSGGGALALERSVKGIDGAAPAPLSGAWLSLLEAG
jgi:peptide/nickel transport system substrate-binding protein